jgi:hypothetical protein
MGPTDYRPGFIEQAVMVREERTAFSFGMFCNMPENFVRPVCGELF